jgi:hypothetical protein
MRISTIHLSRKKILKQDLFPKKTRPRILFWKYIPTSLDNLNTSRVSLKEK